MIHSVRNLLSFLIFVAVGVAANAESVEVREARVTAEQRAGKTWTVLTGRVEAKTELSVGRLAAVLTDWEAYPKFFSKIRQANAIKSGDAVMLTQTTVVSALGFTVTNRFTLRLVSAGRPPDAVSIRWTQEETDGTIDSLSGSWELIPVTEAGKSVTLIRYRTTSAVPQSFPGEAGVLGLFFPGELRQIVASVLSEARQRKEQP